MNELIHPEYVNHAPGWPELPRGRDGVPIVVQALRAAFPDLHYSVQDSLEDDKRIAVRTHVRGTQRGEFMGRPPTGRSFEVTQITIEHVQDGLIVAHHRVTDELSMLRQLGFAH